MDSQWLTANEAAAHLKIKPRTVMQWAREKKIPGYCISGGTQRHIWRFKLSDLDAMLSPSSAESADGRQ